MAPTKPEAKAREEIDRQLQACGWSIQDRATANMTARLGVAVREFPLKGGPVDYLLYVDGAAAGAVEAKPQGFTLSGVEVQNKRYSEGLPDALPAYRRPLPFLYESTGEETFFTNLMDPDPRSRRLFTFHRPETMREWLDDAGYSESVRSIGLVAEPPAVYEAAPTLRAKLQHISPLIEDNLWPPQITAIKNLEQSLAEDRPRALIQMATGSGKTFTACNFTYRLVKHARAKRVLFLVDRANLGRQTRKEFEQFVTPDDGRKFTELYVLQHLQSNVLDHTAKVVVSTIQRIYSMLQGEEELPPEADEASVFEYAPPGATQLPVAYNPKIPIETFDVIITDECHRSIYNLWRQVLEYFDGFIIGLTATPSKQTLGFFNQNLVMEYDHEKAVADAVNVPFDVYEIRTEITQKGATVEAGLFIDKRDRLTRARRWERVDEDFTYSPEYLDRAVVAEDQIRTVVGTFRDKLSTEIFPGRTELPKTLIFAKDDSHAEDIVRIVREEFGRGNDFCQKITYKTTGAKTEDLIASFRNSFNPRIAVTVDMIATGTDIKPLEIVFFMRGVRSRTFFEQMKGRGVRVINSDDLRSVTPDAHAKDHFVIVDAVGICKEDLTDTRPLEKKPTVSFEKLLEQISFGNRDLDILSSLAGRLARLERHLGPDDRKQLEDAAGGAKMNEIIGTMMRALDPDEHIGAAKAATGLDEPPPEAVHEAAKLLIEEAAGPIASNPVFRNKLIEVRQSFEQTIDVTTKDVLLKAGYSAEATEAAKSIVTSFEEFIAEHKDEITALQILYSRPYRQGLTYEQIKELADAIQRPPRQWTPDVLWRAYEQLDKSKVRGSGRRVLTDLVSLIRFAVHSDDELVPFPDRVAEKFENWIAQQENLGKTFIDEQRRWLEMMRDQIATSLAIDVDDFEYTPFNQHGGLGKAVQLFGDDLPKLIEELNEALPG
ncbi:MAG: type I restriction-modification enzyme R subunit C-terminal domain-containing protein [Actinomycetota bacterium]|nr:DEAD/DEAH box helicase family protein [Actinomycetota bacterium]